MDIVKQSMYAGAAAGASRLLIFAPFDLLKTRAQAQKTGKIRYLKMVR